LRRTFGEEGRDAFDKVIGRRTLSKADRLGSQMFGQRSSERLANQSLGVAHCKPWRGDERPNDGVGRGFELRTRDDLTIPSRSASAASNRSLSRRISIALRAPTRRGSDQEPPPSGVNAR
jgi:hypothetical protein